jgi:hypothetical protein
MVVKIELSASNTEISFPFDLFLPSTSECPELAGQEGKVSAKAARKDQSAHLRGPRAKSDQAHTRGEGETEGDGFGKDIRVEGGVLAWSHPGRKGEPVLLLPKSVCWGHSAAFAITSFVHLHPREAQLCQNLAGPTWGNSAYNQAQM